jgi:hypothetical protein
MTHFLSFFQQTLAVGRQTQTVYFGWWFDKFTSYQRKHKQQIHPKLYYYTCLEFFSLQVPTVAILEPSTLRWWGNKFTSFQRKH